MPKKAFDMTDTISPSGSTVAEAEAFLGAHPDIEAFDIVLHELVPENRPCTSDQIPSSYALHKVKVPRATTAARHPPGGFVGSVPARWPTRSVLKNETR